MLGGQLFLLQYICEFRTHNFTKYEPMLGGLVVFTQMLFVGLELIIYLPNPKV
jgi:hypothetical protein